MTNADIARRLRITDVTVAKYLNTDRIDYGENAVTGRADKSRAHAPVENAESALQSAKAKLVEVLERVEKGVERCFEARFERACAVG
ncbi:MAG: hypothetical protein AAF307_07545 [Pseudomonadota bacterium]